MIEKKAENAECSVNECRRKRREKKRREGKPNGPLEGSRLELASYAVHLGAPRNQVAHNIDAVINCSPMEESDTLCVWLIHIDANHFHQLAHPTACTGACSGDE